jgi:hypothetical protein
VTISGSTQYLGVKPYGMDRFDQFVHRTTTGFNHDGYWDHRAEQLNLSRARQTSRYRSLRS